MRLFRLFLAFLFPLFFLVNNILSPYRVVPLFAIFPPSPISPRLLIHFTWLEVEVGRAPMCNLLRASQEKVKKEGKKKVNFTRFSRCHLSFHFCKRRKERKKGWLQGRMQKFSSFPSYKVLDRTKRDPEKEMGDHIFVGRCHLVTSPQEDLRPAFEKSQSSDNLNTAATQELRPTEVSPPETGSIVARWAQEKRHEAAFLPVPRLPQPSPREPHVLLVDTPTA